MPSTNWSTTDLLNTTVAAFNLMATGTGVGGVRAAVGSTTGKYYFEIQLNLFGFSSGIGIGNAAATLTNVAAAPTNACLAYRDGRIWLNNVNTGRMVCPANQLYSGRILGVALDMDTQQIWMRICPSGVWLNAAGNNPETGVGGLSVASIVSASVAAFPLFGSAATNERITANFGATPFCGAVPAGYTPGYPASSLNPPINEIWNGADKSPTAILTSANLQVTFPTVGGGIRTTTRVVAGKFYFEYTGSCWFSGSTGVGVAHGGAALATAGQTPLGAAFVYSGGAIYINNAYQGSLGAITAGDSVAIALDRDNARIWFRKLPSGNWNNSGTADPVNNIGGFSIISIASIQAVYAMVSASNGAEESIIANFGDSPFLGVVPSGFTAGWPIAAIPEQAIALTHITAEQWNIPDPQGMLTQMAIEEWAVGGNPVQGIVTQMAIEQWATLKSGGGTQVRVMILA